MGGNKDDVPTPPAPGWYPDPWSADGAGERYFDGKRWGTTERPMGRDATVTELKPRRRARRRGRSRTIIAFVVLVAVAFGLSRVQQGSKRTAHAATVPSTNSLAAKAFDRPPVTPEAAAPLGHPGPVPAGTGKFETLEDQPGDPSKPVAWDPCRPIHYVVNPAGAPPDGAAMVKSAIARVERATGLHFVSDGATKEQPNKDRLAYQPARYGSRWAPVLIAWSDERAYPDLAGYIAGIGSPASEYSRDDHLLYVSGQVVFDRVQMSATQIPNRAEAKAIVLHELGHLVGLGHTSDRRQIMFSESEFNVTDYADGDLRGLALLGTQPCYPDV